MLAVVLFLIVFGGVGLALVKSPEKIAQQIQKRGMVIPFLELAHTKWGRFQMRFVGLAFFLFSILTLAYLLVLFRSGRAH